MFPNEEEIKNFLIFFTSWKTWVGITFFVGINVIIALAASFLLFSFNGNVFYGTICGAVSSIIWIVATQAVPKEKEQPVKP